MYFTDSNPATVWAAAVCRQWNSGSSRTVNKLQKPPLMFCSFRVSSVKDRLLLVKVHQSLTKRATVFFAIARETADGGSSIKMTDSLLIFGDGLVWTYRPITSELTSVFVQTLYTLLDV